MKIPVFLILASTLLFPSCVRRSEKFYFGNYSEAERHYNQGEYEKAIEKYQAYVSESPEGDMALISRYYMAKSHAALGQTAEAREIYRKILKESPQSMWAQFAKTQITELEKSG